jgi:iron complex outermembrane receptor protein
MHERRRVVWRHTWRVGVLLCVALVGVPRPADARRPTSANRFAGAPVLATAHHPGHTTSTAHTRPAAPCEPPTLRVAATWPAPLDRAVTVRGGVLSLRDALDRLSAASGVRLSYSDALLALDAPVCLDVRAAALGDVLAALTIGSGVTPRVAGPTLAVLAPAPAAPLGGSEVRARVTAPAPPSLERVVVTGSVAGRAQRGLGTAVSVVSGSSLTAAAGTTTAGLINGSAPGVWIWQQAPTAMLARYGSLRGASSFGVSYPKIYVDGVEVANPLVVAHLPAESLDRAEVLPGPQGAALYGTDAISGVIQFVTRAPLSRMEAPGVRTRADVAQVASAFATGGTLGQRYAIQADAGSVARAASAALSYTRLGAFVPDASSGHLTVSARARQLGRTHVLDATVRGVAADIASAGNPLLLTAVVDAITLPDTLRPVLGPRRRATIIDSIARRLSLDRVARQSLRQLTAGVTMTSHASPVWTHRGTFGVDAYALEGTPSGGAPLPTSTDSALRAAEGTAMRVSARASSAGHWQLDDTRTTLTLTIEHALLREATSNAVLARPGSVTTFESDPLAVWRATNGVAAQLDADWRARWYLTLGTRVERSAGFTDRVLTTALPMLAASWVHDEAWGTVTVRSAYGKGIRPPRATIAAPGVDSARLVPNPALDVEAQAGTEFGVDVVAGSRMALHATRFDQRATGLVQPVTLVVSGPATGGAARPGDPLARQLAYQLQNVGAIANRGWELAASVHGGPVALHGTMGTVDSRVREVRRGYGGELQAGDRMLDVPARTMGASAVVTHGPWQSTVQLSRVEDWIGYDRLAATEAFATLRRPTLDFVGTNLRQFWMRYPGVTRLNASLSRTVGPGLSLAITGENLLDVQVGEPDNATIVPGRLLSVGVRARF